MTVLIAGCARRSPGSALLAGQTSCYRTDSSIIYPLGDVRPAPGRKQGAWLVLRPVRYRAIADRYEAVAVDVVGNEQAGVWWLAGDTVHLAVHDVFTTNELQLVPQRRRLVGVGRGSTDVLEQRAGAYAAHEDTWTADLRLVNCQEVPSGA